MPPSASDKNQAKLSGHAAEEIDGELNEWKFRAPYKVHTNDRNFKALYEGSCHCGRIQYQLNRRSLLMRSFVTVRLARFCMGHHFNGLQFFIKMILISLADTMIWDGMRVRKRRHDISYLARYLAHIAGAQSWTKGRRMILLFPSLIKFKSKKEKENFNPTCHMFYDQRLVDIPDGLPKWAGMQKNSELIEDSPPEEIKKRKREIEEEENNGNKSAKTK